MVPVVYAVAGIPLQQLYVTLQELWPTVARWTIVVVLAVVGLGTLQANYANYFDTYAQRTPNLMAISMAHTIQDHRDDSIFYIYGAPNFYAEYGVLRFVTPESIRNNATLVEEVEAAIRGQQGDDPKNATNKGVMIIALLHRLQEIDTLAEMFPGGLYEEHRTPAGQLLYVSYRLTAEQVASFADGNGASVSSAEQTEKALLRETGPLPDHLLSPLPTPISASDTNE